MKKILIIIALFIVSFSYSQTYELSETGSIILDSTLTRIYNVENYQNYRNSNNIDYYDKRIKDVLIKYYWVIENEFEEANANGWFLLDFKHGYLMLKKFLN